MPGVLGLGFSSIVDEDPNFEKLRRNLDEAASLGVEFVELPLFAMDVIAGGRVLTGQVERLKGATAGRGVGYTVHGPIAANFMDPPDRVARHLAVARATIEIAAELGAVHLILHTGSVRADSDADIEAAYGAQRRTLAALGDFAAQHGIVLAIENVFVSEPERHTALPSRLAAEIAAIGHAHVRACLDFSHAFITATAQGANVLDEVRALAPYAKHLHLHDSFGDPARLWTVSRSERMAYGLGDLHLPLGWGSIPWDEIMRTLTFQPDVIFNLELPPPYWFMLGDCIAQMRRYREAYLAAQAARA